MLFEDVRPYSPKPIERYYRIYIDKYTNTRAHKNTKTHTDTHTHIYLSIYLSIDLSIYLDR